MNELVKNPIFCIEPSPSLDAKYGPYPTVLAADEALRSQDVVAKGLTVGVLENGMVVEYWYQPNFLDGLALVPKKRSPMAVSVSYSKLLALRDGANLVPGTWYRITDYRCTTKQANTEGEFHAFDIIVRADDASHLNENAFAAHHTGDTYFANCKLEAWELKYCLDNDTDRFAWADEHNGRGVVFYMKDEWGNIAPFDFKNMLFIRDSEWFVDHILWAEKVFGRVPEADMPFYFLSWVTEDGEVQDASIVGQTLKNLDGGCTGVYDNEIKETTAYDMGVTNGLLTAFALPRTIIVSSYAYAEGVFYGCYGNKFGNGCCDNSLGNGCFNNSFENGCCDNLLGNGCFNNSFENGCCDNLLLEYCQSINVFKSVRYCEVRGGTKEEPVKNAQILNGTAGEDTNHKLGIVFQANLDSMQCAATSRESNLKVWLPVDFV